VLQLITYYRWHWWWIRYRRGRFDCSPFYSRVRLLEVHLEARSVDPELIKCMRDYYAADRFDMLPARLRAFYAGL